MKVSLKIHSRLLARLSTQARKAATAAIAKTAVAAVDTISRIADAKLGKTAQAFKDALADAVTVNSTGLRIELTGLAKELNDGYPARDMKSDLLASPNAKVSKKGARYIDIPFRHTLKTLPGSVRNSVERQVTRELSAARSEGRPAQSPLQVVGTLPGQTNTQQRFNSRGGSKEVQVKQQTSIYSQMFRVARGSTGSYQTIRRVSENSEKQSWWHPGFEGIRALQQAKTEIQRTLQMFLKQELAGNGLKSK